MSFDAVESRLFFTRNDASDLRLGDLAKALPESIQPSELKKSLAAGASISAQSKQFVLAGYPDDEGIRINGGRLGAAQAPDAIRRWLYRMTPQLLASHALASQTLALDASHLNGFMLWDLGNLKSTELTLEARHGRVSEYARAALDSGATWLGLGGGHDYGFADAAAFIEWTRSQSSHQGGGHRPLILNFDAHLDVRPTDRGLSSGTPFFRMLETYPDVDFAEIGIQGQCNSAAHLQWAKSRGARVLSQEEIEASGESFVTTVLQLLDDWVLRPRPVFISVDIDGFSSMAAPGCSQSWPTGFMVADFFPLLEVLKQRLQIKILSIYEVSPPLDINDQTAKLAAQILHRIIE